MPAASLWQWNADDILLSFRYWTKDEQRLASTEILSFPEAPDNSAPVTMQELLPAEH